MKYRHEISTFVSVFSIDDLLCSFIFVPRPLLTLSLRTKFSQTYVLIIFVFLAEMNSFAFELVR